jgi:hypothetical protein
MELLAALPDFTMSPSPSATLTPAPVFRDPDNIQLELFAVC